MHIPEDTAVFSSLACVTDGMNSGCAGSSSLCRGVNSGTSGSMTAVCLGSMETRFSLGGFSFVAVSDPQLVGTVVGGGELEAVEGRLLPVEDDW